MLYATQNDSTENISAEIKKAREMCAEVEKYIRTQRAKNNWYIDGNTLEYLTTEWNKPEHKEIKTLIVSNIHTDDLSQYDDLQKALCVLCFICKSIDSNLSDQQVYDLSKHIYNIIDNQIPAVQNNAVDKTKLLLENIKACAGIYSNFSCNFLARVNATIMKKNLFSLLYVPLLHNANEQSIMYSNKKRNEINIILNTILDCMDGNELNELKTKKLFKSLSQSAQNMIKIGKSGNNIKHLLNKYILGATTDTDNKENEIMNSIPSNILADMSLIPTMMMMLVLSQPGKHIMNIVPPLLEYDIINTIQLPWSVIKEVIAQMADSGHLNNIIVPIIKYLSTILVFLPAYKELSFISDKTITMHAQQFKGVASAFINAASGLIDKIKNIGNANPVDNKPSDVFDIMFNILKITNSVNITPAQYELLFKNIFSLIIISCSCSGLDSMAAVFNMFNSSGVKYKDVARCVALELAIMLDYAAYQLIGANIDQSKSAAPLLVKDYQDYKRQYAAIHGYASTNSLASHSEATNLEVVWVRHGLMIDSLTYKIIRAMQTQGVVKHDRCVIHKITDKMSNTKKVGDILYAAICEEGANQLIESITSKNPTNAEKIAAGLTPTIGKGISGFDYFMQLQNIYQVYSKGIMKNMTYSSVLPVPSESELYSWRNEYIYARILNKITLTNNNMNNDLIQQINQLTYSAISKTPTLDIKRGIDKSPGIKLHQLIVQKNLLRKQLLELAQKEYQHYGPDSGGHQNCIVHYEAVLHINKTIDSLNSTKECEELTDTEQVFFVKQIINYYTAGKLNITTPIAPINVLPHSQIGDHITSNILPLIDFMLPRYKIYTELCDAFIQASSKRIEYVRHNPTEHFNVAQIFKEVIQSNNIDITSQVIALLLSFKSGAIQFTGSTNNYIDLDSVIEHFHTTLNKQIIDSKPPINSMLKTYKPVYTIKQQVTTQNDANILNPLITWLNYEIKIAQSHYNKPITIMPQTDGNLNKSVNIVMNKLVTNMSSPDGNAIADDQRVDDTLKHSKYILGAAGITIVALVAYVTLFNKASRSNTPSVTANLVDINENKNPIRNKTNK